MCQNNYIQEYANRHPIRMPVWCLVLALSSLIFGCTKPTGQDRSISNAAVSCFPCGPYNDVFLCPLQPVGDCIRLKPAHKADVSVALNLGDDGTSWDSTACHVPEYRLQFHLKDSITDAVSLSFKCRTVRVVEDGPAPFLNNKAWNRLEVVVQELGLNF